MLSHYFGTALLVTALAAAGLEHTTNPASAQAPNSSRCEIASIERCELTGFNLVPDPNDPAVYVLQLDTTRGPHAFAADRGTLERLARELLDAVEGRGAKRL